MFSLQRRWLRYFGSFFNKKSKNRIVKLRVVRPGGGEPLWKRKHLIVGKETISGPVLCQLIGGRQRKGSGEAGHSHDLWTQKQHKHKHPLNNTHSCYKKNKASKTVGSL